MRNFCYTLGIAKAEEVINVFSLFSNLLGEEAIIWKEEVEEAQGGPAEVTEDLAAEVMEALEEDTEDLECRQCTTEDT